jgi:RNA polymerase sigma factor (sigma-70 family)
MSQGIRVVARRSLQQRGWFGWPGLVRTAGASAGSGDPLLVGDRDLLSRFVDGDQHAFAELVSRHAGLVMGVCRRLLPQVADAEDAFQATFLVLARKAAALRWHESLAGWLHETARHSALKLRSAATRRGALVRRAASLQAAEQSVAVPADPARQADVRELSALLDEELVRLPERFREVILLSCLEGLSREEVAARLGITAAAVKDRLERGREQLRQRLVRRGVTLTAVSLAAWLIPSATYAAGTTGLIAGTTQVAGAFATGQLAAGTAPVAVGVAQGVLHMMGLKKLQVAGTYLATMLMAGTVCYGMLQDAPRRFEQGVRGEVVEIHRGSTPTVTIAMEEFGTWLNLDISPQAKVWTAFEAAQLDDLAVGQFVALHLGPDHRTVQELHIQGAVREVAVQRVAPSGKLVVIDADNDDPPVAATEVELAPDAIMRIGGLPATVDDLQPGTVIPLEFGRDGSRVNAIESQVDPRLYVEGILRRINVAKGEAIILRDNGEEEERVEKPYVFTRDSILTGTKAKETWESLPVPCEVQLRLAPDGRTIRALRVGATIIDDDVPQVDDDP